MKNAVSSLLRVLDGISPPQKAQAHCDVPCGVYEPDSMLWAVETCMKLVEKILVLELPDTSDRQSLADHHNTVVRAIHEKEKYAQICKEQILILWTDYFKPEHLAKWPDLHDKIWKAAKQCSVVKRTVSLDEVKKLKTLVDEVAEIFRATKK
ncbi:MAG: superoxide dismutase, Ni [Patescibacteria group bacterium]